MIRTTIRSDWGQLSIGPIGLPDQSLSRISVPISPRSERK